MADTRTPAEVPRIRPLRLDDSAQVPSRNSRRDDGSVGGGTAMDV
jgi:hypothetical protein